MKIGIIREGKIPVDKRVPLIPYQCRILAEQYADLSFVIQSSPVRCISDTDYQKFGLIVQEDLSDCDVLFGVKEVPLQDLIPDKTYFFFSHTIKKQAHNRNLLKKILDKRITLIDYECLTDNLGNRIVAFGRFAGIVGAYNGIMTYGQKYQLFDLKRAFLCQGMKELKQQFDLVQLPPIKIVVTGTGRVGRGAKEILDGMKIKHVFPNEFLQDTFQEAVYTVLSSDNYYLAKDGQTTDLLGFYAHPENYVSDFLKYIEVSDLIITAHFWDPKAAPLFSKEDVGKNSFKPKVIADITCDIEGSIPTTLKASSIAEPVYDYNPQTEELEPAFSDEKNISVMAVDNLPCELPLDASESFGEQLMLYIFPALLEGDKDKILERASITKEGSLMPDYEYLADFMKD